MSTPIKSEEFTKTINSIEHNIWTRFMGDDSIMYDYAGLNGEIILPTPEECNEHKPNALAWWAPIDNGGFYNGYYLRALLASYAMTQEATRITKIQKRVSELSLQQDVGSTTGFIYR